MEVQTMVRDNCQILKYWMEEPQPPIETKPDTTTIAQSSFVVVMILILISIAVFSGINWMWCLMDETDSKD